MKITTNYESYDWKLLLINLAIVGVPSILFFSLSTYYVFLPLMDAWALFVDDISNDELIKTYIENNYDMNSMSVDDFNHVFVGSFTLWLCLIMGPPVICILVMLYFTEMIIYFSKKLSKKLGYSNLMKLVIFRNGKPIKF